MKKCSKCLEIKAFENYYKRNGNKDGHHNMCIQCWKNKNQKWYQNNRQQKLDYASIKRETNKPQANQYAKNYRKNNPEKIKQDNLIWRKNNPEKVRELEHRRRARIKNNGEYEIRKSFLIKLYKSPCINCGELGNITQDHIVPIARGGQHSEGNLQPLCKKCNSSKKDKLMTEWRY